MNYNSKQNRFWSHETAHNAIEALIEDVKLKEDAPDKPMYRSVVSLNLFGRFFAEARQFWEEKFPQLKDKYDRNIAKDLNWAHEDRTGLKP